MAEVARRVPTINDLRVKLCYICREEDRFDNPENPPQIWTHPCDCTLVAHETCLLQWIQSAQSDTSRAANALKCPQCGAIYELESDNPVLLRILNVGNKTLSILGKAVTFTGLSAVIVSFGAGIYCLSTGYGAFALNQFVGQEMYDLLLTHDISAWPWHAFFNLPIIPLSLILSRTPFFSAVVPIVPVLLAWPISTPVATRERILLERWSSSSSEVLASDVAPGPLISWPPSPAVFGLLLFPLVRAFYRSFFTRFTHWVLNTQPGRRPPVMRFILALNAPFLIQFGANIEQAPAARANGQQPANPDADENANRAVAAEDVIQVTGSSIGRLVGGALMLPTISSIMGSFLFRLSYYSPLLRRFLAVRPSVINNPPPLGPWSYSDNSNKLSPLRQVGVVVRSMLSLAWKGTRTWTECDPVWWRNSVGLGIFVVAKDCLHLLHLWYVKRELETRRVKNKSFECVDIRELDLIEPAGV